jgi:hypothetical protein
MNTVGLKHRKSASAETSVANSDDPDNNIHTLYLRIIFHISSMLPSAVVFGTSYAIYFSLFSHACYKSRPYHPSPSMLHELPSYDFETRVTSLHPAPIFFCWTNKECALKYIIHNHTNNYVINIF